MVHALHSLACDHHAASDSDKLHSRCLCTGDQHRPDPPSHRAERDAKVHLVKSALSPLRDRESHATQMADESSAAAQQGFSGSVVETDGLSAEDNDRLTELHTHELSANTRKSYRVQWSGFVNWAQSRGFCALPASPDVVAAYLAERFERYQHKPATLRLAASAIGALPQGGEAGQPN